MSRKRYLFIVNPISGGKSKSHLKATIQEKLHPKGIDFEVIYTEFPLHAGKIAQDRMDDFDVIVAVGGDGTINDIAAKLGNKKSALAIVPMGSGNGLARHLNISLSPEKAISSIDQLKLKEIDSALLNGHFFVSIAGIGFDSLIAAEFEKAAGRGFVTYARLVIREYFNYKEKNYSLNLDGKTHERKAFMIIFANSNQFGYNTRIAPEADISDSLLDVCIVRKPSLLALPYLLWQVWTGKANRSKQIEIIRAQKISVNQGSHSFANIDGESVEVGNQIDIQVKNKDLLVMAP